MSSNNITCNVFQQILLPCKDNIGGIKNAWITDFEHFGYTVTTSSIGASDYNTIVTFATSSGSTGIYQITPARTSGNTTEDQVVDTTNTLWKQVVTLVYPKNQASIRNFVQSLGKSTIVCIVQDRNNLFWAYGTDNGLQVSTKHQTGTVESDKNTWTFGFEGTEAYPALPVSAATMLPFIVV